MSMTTDTDEFDALPPSAKYVYEVIDAKGPLPQKDIIAETSLSDTTVWRALNQLEDLGLVTGRSPTHDLRQTLYSTDSA